MWLKCYFYQATDFYAFLIHVSPVIFLVNPNESHIAGKDTNRYCTAQFNTLTAGKAPFGNYHITTTV